MTFQGPDSRMREAFAVFEKRIFLAFATLLKEHTDGREESFEDFTAKITLGAVECMNDSVIKMKMLVLCWVSIFDVICCSIHQFLGHVHELPGKVQLLGKIDEPTHRIKIQLPVLLTIHPFSSPARLTQLGDIPFAVSTHFDGLIYVHNLKIMHLINHDIVNDAKPKFQTLQRAKIDGYGG